MSKNLIIGIVAVVVLGGGALFVREKFVQEKPQLINPESTQVVQNQQPSPTAPATSPAPVTQNQPKPPVTKPSATKPAVTKPVAVASIVSVQMSSGLSASGVALNTSTTFSPTAPTLHAVLSLKNATQRTQLSYIRYYNGKYVDSNVAHPEVSDAK